MEKKLARPAPVNKTIYINFVHKCRKNGYEVRDVEEKLYTLYQKKGEEIFSNL